MEEYKALNDEGRHDDTVGSATSAVFVPLSLAAVVAACQAPKLIWPLGIASIALYRYHGGVLLALGGAANMSPAADGESEADYAKRVWSVPEIVVGWSASEPTA